MRLIMRKNLSLFNLQNLKQAVGEFAVKSGYFVIKLGISMAFKWDLPRKKYFQIALQRNWDFPKFYEILGDLEMLKGNFLGLLENYNKSLSINADQPVLLSKLIFNYNYINYDQKDYFNVIDNYKKLLVNLKCTTEVKNIPKKPSGLHSMNEHDEIKVGFITSDFREHPIGFQTLSILKELKNFKKMKMYSFCQMVIFHLFFTVY